jgi:hypothetical protein
MKAIVLAILVAACGDDTSCAPTPVQDGTTLIATAQAQPIALAIAGDRLFWTNLTDGTIASAPKRGGCTQILVRGAPGPFAIAVDQTHVWWTNVMDGGVRRVPIAGDAAETIATAQDHPGAIVVSGSVAFWMNYGTTGTLMRWRVGDTSAMAVATNLSAPGGITADADMVYWGAQGTLWRASLSGGSPTMLLPAQPGSPSPHALVVGNGVLFFLQAPTLGWFRCPMPARRLFCKPR